MPKLRWRAPDKPQRTYSLTHVREGEHLAQIKIDGHCAVISKDDDGIIVMSRHQKPLGISDALREQIAAINMKDGDQVVGEWTGLRESNRIESLRLFSMHYQGFDWLGGMGEEERYNRLASAIKPTDMITVLEAHDTGYADLFTSTIDDWETEGIVVKHKAARLKGGVDGSLKNGAFQKLKWRDGSDGKLICHVPDEELVCAV
jgi:ATP-dependent DNA ligase